MPSLDPAAASPARVVVVDRDDSSSRQLAALLRQGGHIVIRASDPLVCLDICAAGQVDLVVTDLVDGPVTGLDLCQQLTVLPGPAVVVCSRRADEVDKVLALEMGADDYVTRPYSERELLLRVAAVLRRGHRGGPRVTRLVTDLGLLSLEAGTGVVVLSDRRTTLTAPEFRLLSALAAADGRLLTRRRLQWAVWEQEPAPDDELLEACVRRVRRKVDGDATSSLILTVRKQGYRLACSGPPRSRVDAARVRSLPDER